MGIKTDNRHLYLQVMDRIKSNIEEGIYQEEEKLPSEFELSKELGISRATLREALRVLEEEKVIIRKHGIGTFVNSSTVFASGIEQLESITTMIKRAGKKPGTIMNSSTIIPISSEDKERFIGIETDEVVLLERIRTADGDPICYCLDKIPTSIMGKMADMEEESLLTILAKKTNRTIQYAVTEIEPLGYHEKISPILGCTNESAILVLKQMHYDQYDNPVLYSVNYFRGDVFNFHVLRKRSL